jgi:BirA family biotin operon repressor/biotin-[acetyl-CoA-carboxylase] ligase
MSSKEQLLAYLKEEKGKWVSGESLSRKMAVTRSAVWKHILRLKEEGYVIESSRRKGYLFRQSSDLLLAHEIREGLQTRVFGKQDIVYFQETDSTNLRAKSLADRGAPEGTVVIAESQTEGRGRRGRTWFSPAGEGIYVSVILRPVLSPHEAPRLTLMAAVAAAETLLHLTPLNVRIRWPNDILVGGKKLAGILTQVSTEMDAVDYIVVGIGINVNTPLKGFPDDLRDRATSIRAEMKEPFPRIRLLRLYLERFEDCYGTFRRSGFQPILERWKELSDIIGRRIRVDLLNHHYRGKVLDVDQDGVLILSDQDGITRRIVSGDVTRLDG